VGTLENERAQVQELRMATCELSEQALLGGERPWGALVKTIVVLA